MRRLIALGLTTFVVLAAGSSASAKRTLVEEKEYSGAQGFSVQDQVNVFWTNLVAEVPRSTAPAGAKTVSVQITDQTGQPVAGHVHVDGHGDGKKVKAYDICAETPAPLALEPHSVVEVLVVSGSCAGGFGLATSGTITFTYDR